MKRGTVFIWSLTILLFGFFSCAQAVTRFEDCSQAREYFVSHALKEVTAYGLGGDYFPFPPFFASPFAAPAAPQEPSARENFSTTNFQEAGVDEPDYVKTDGRFLYLLRETKLYIFQPTENSLKQVATLSVGEKDKTYTEMFLSGNYLLLIGRSYQSGANQLLLVDVSNPSQPKTVQALQMDGNLLDARLSEGVVRIVVDASPMRFAWHTPALGLPLEDAPDSLELNRRLVENSTIANWLPYAILTNSGSGEKQTFPLSACTDIYAPDQYSGFRTITLLSIDLSKGDLSAHHGATLIAEGDMIYASRENLYVTTSPWNFFLASVGDNSDQQNSVIHKFAFKGSASEYAASGKVPGRIRDQWSFSEYEGDLRVLSTQDIPTGDNQFTSVSQIAVLRQQDNQLKPIGAIGGLGIGEFVQSVRFIGPTGYVVTFRQMDPLFVVDLSDPTQPKVTGELEIPGFSAYLHPLGKNLLLGIGQGTDTEGRTQGMQVSLFDVSDPTNPRRLQNLILQDAWSQVDWDHKAFLWWEPKQMLFAPFEKPDYFAFSGSPIPAVGEKSEPGDAGVIAAQIKNRQLEHIATLRNAGIDEPWQKRSAKRTIIINNKVFTISSPYASNPSIGVHDLDTLQTIDRIMLKTGESE